MDNQINQDEISLPMQDWVDKIKQYDYKTKSQEVLFGLKELWLSFAAVMVVLVQVWQENDGNARLKDFLSRVWEAFIISFSWIASNTPAAFSTVVTTLKRMQIAYQENRELRELEKEIQTSSETKE